MGAGGGPPIDGWVYVVLSVGAGAMGGVTGGFLPQYFKQLVAASPTTNDPYAGFGNPKAVGHEGYQLSVRNTLHRS
jgi:hypothetical protein